MLAAKWGDFRVGLRVRSAYFEGGEPESKFVEKRSQEESAEDRRALLDSTQGAAQKRTGSDGVARMEVVEGSGHLNEGLEEALLWFLEAEPRAFPVLVRLEKLPVPVAGEAGGEMR